MSHRDTDLSMLADLLDKHIDELSERELEAFLDMRLSLKMYPKDIAERHGFRELTEKQREWLTAVHQRVIPQYANLVSQGLVPRGREVPSMVGALPKRPPPMPKPAAPQRVTAEHRPFRAMGLDEPDDDT
jgi:hypothetical protein